MAADELFCTHELDEGKASIAISMSEEDFSGWHQEYLIRPSVIIRGSRIGSAYVLVCG